MLAVSATLVPDPSPEVVVGLVPLDPCATEGDPEMPFAIQSAQALLLSASSCPVLLHEVRVVAGDPLTVWGLFGPVKIVTDLSNVEKKGVVVVEGCFGAVYVPF